VPWLLLRYGVETVSPFWNPLTMSAILLDSRRSSFSRLVTSPRLLNLNAYRTFQDFICLHDLILLRFMHSRRQSEPRASCRKLSSQLGILFLTRIRTWYPCLVLLTSACWTRSLPTSGQLNRNRNPQRERIKWSRRLREQSSKSSIISLERNPATPTALEHEMVGAVGCRF